jgi:hypothetical protein
MSNPLLLIQADMRQERASKLTLEFRRARSSSLENLGRNISSGRGYTFNPVLPTMHHASGHEYESAI